MKEFVKTMLAVICAFIVLRLLAFLFILVAFGSAMAGGNTTVRVTKNSVLDLGLSTFQMAEQTQDPSAQSFTNFSRFNVLPQVGLHDAVKAIEAAAADPAIKFILLRPDGLNAGMAQLEELRTALKGFRQSGKAVVAYTENPGNGSYYLASVADKVFIGAQHGGSPQLIGLSSQMIFLKDLLDKVGVHVQLIRHGKYKSAGEMFIRSTASAENREQNQTLVNTAWDAMASYMAEARDLPVDRLNFLVDGLAFNLPEDFLRYGLADEMLDHETLLARLTTLAEIDDAKKLHLVPFADYVTARVVPSLGGTQVAVLYADGDIVDGKGYEGVAGDRFVREIDALRKDASVKAVVLRVNSPGGSVSASVKIRAALDELQKVKPLVASYGNYAASGGYWISNGCQKIYADATTVTGSIGVFSMIPEFSQVTKKLGVGVETVGSNKHSDMYALTRPFDAQELAYLQASVEDIYEMFVNLVASSRGMEPAQVDAIAQGRVWAGADALNIGLVDEIGTLEDAIRYAAALADFHSSDQYKVVGYPQPLSIFEQLLSSMGQNMEEPYVLADTPFAALSGAVEALKPGQPGAAYARLPYALDIR